MDHKRSFFYAATLVLMAFLASGCMNFGNSGDTSAYDGGVFKSADKGSSWQQRALMPTTTGAPRSFASVSVASMAMDPNDENAVYYGSIGNGLIYSLDGGASWRLVPELGKVTIRSIAVDPEDKCTVYAAVGNKVYKTEDCTRGWRNIYFDNDTAATVDSVAIDHYNKQAVYIGNSRGDIIKSLDGGESWRTAQRIKGRIMKIAIDPNDSRIIYAVTEKNGVFRTFDGGESWEDGKEGGLNKVLKEFSLGYEVKDVAFVKDEPRVVYVATNYGLLRSSDQGKKWESIDLIPPEKQAIINAIAVNPRNSEEIYYVTYTTFFRSLDGGESWSTIKLPTSRAGWTLLINPNDPNIIYMGVRGFKK